MRATGSVNPLSCPPHSAATSQPSRSSCGQAPLSTSPPSSACLRRCSRSSTTMPTWHGLSPRLAQTSGWLDPARRGSPARPPHSSLSIGICQLLPGLSRHRSRPPRWPRPGHSPGHPASPAARWARAAPSSRVKLLAPLGPGLGRRARRPPIRGGTIRQRMPAPARGPRRTPLSACCARRRQCPRDELMSRRRTSSRASRKAPPLDPGPRSPIRWFCSPAGPRAWSGSSSEAIPPTRS